LPVHPKGTPLLRLAVTSTNHWPWRLIGERDAAAVMEFLREREPLLVALSSHDSTPWTFDAFGAEFGDRFSTLKVGARIEITS
jgi:hypothetical protein